MSNLGWTPKPARSFSGFNYYRNGDGDPYIEVVEAHHLRKVSVARFAGGTSKLKDEQFPLPEFMCRDFENCDRIVRRLINHASDHPDWNDPDAAYELARDRAEEDAFDARQAAE